MRKKLKGSALLWSVCALLIVAFVLTGLLAINKSYAEEEINNIASRRAEYLARSGVELTVNLIENNKLEQISDTSKGENVEALITYELGEPVTVKITKSHGKQIIIRSFACAGNMKNTICAVMEYEYNRNNREYSWEFKGYVKY